jgi:hypothetical protein
MMSRLVSSWGGVRLIAVWIMHAYSGSSSVGGEPVVASRSSSAEERRVQLAATPSPWISLLFGGPGSRNSQARAQRNRHAHMSARNTDDEKGMHRVVRVPPGPGVPETMTTTWTHSECCNASLACGQPRFACRARSAEGIASATQ